MKQLHRPNEPLELEGTKSGAGGDNAAIESLFALLQKNVLSRRRRRSETRCA